MRKRGLRDGGGEAKYGEKAGHRLLPRLTRPGLAFGRSGGGVIVIAGLVEFSLAFTLVMERALVRVAALIAVFVSAVPEFGTWTA